MQNSLKSGDLIIEGYLGKKINDCINNGIMVTDFHKYIVPFYEKTDSYGQFCGEFWGKWITSAISAYRYQSRTEWRKIIDEAVDGILKAQEPSGRLSCSDVDYSSWDIWGRKYTILGLLSYYETTNDERALDAARRSVDELINTLTERNIKLIDTGFKAIGGMASSSILKAILLLYKIKKDKKYLDFSERIIAEWSAPSTFYKEGARIIEDTASGKRTVDIATPKAYEIMSCFEGLCEYYKITRNEAYKEIVLKYANGLLENEIMIVGSGSSSELWCDGKIRQTELIEQPMETCVTATWIKFCGQLYSITGDCKWIDQAEITLYNALFGAMTDNGKWWAYFSPMTGARLKSPIQLEKVGTSCCVASGPRGLLSITEWAITAGEDEISINLYFNGSFAAGLSGGRVEFSQETKYPEEGKILFRVKQIESFRYTVKLRIPFWSKKTKVLLNGREVEVEVDEKGYLSLNRKWNNGDIIELWLDLSGRIITIERCANFKAIMVGPIVLAFDNRLVKENTKTLWLFDNSLINMDDPMLSGVYYKLSNIDTVLNNESIRIKKCENKPDNIWISYEVEFLYRATHFFNHRIEKVTMCDYASAGNEYKDDNILRVWLPQPLYLMNAFPRCSQYLLKDKCGSST